MIKYGVVGTGYFGADLARALQNTADAKVVSVFDPANGAPIAEELGADNETSLDALIAREDIDCVVVATPNYLHKEPVMKAAAAHKNVFCEKPIALNYRDCVDMVDACKEAGVVFMAGHIMNFFNGVHHAKALINNGTIGDVLFIKSVRNGWEEPQDAVSWKKIRAKSGGHLYHHIHELDCVQFLMGGLPQAVTMSAANVAHQSENFGDEDDMVLMQLEFANHRYAQLEWGSAFQWGEHYVLIEGTKGAIKLDMFDTAGTLRVAGQDSHFLIHTTQEEDDDRTRIYHGPAMDGAIQYGHPGNRTPMWLMTLIVEEMAFLNKVLQGEPVPDEYAKLLDGTAAEEAIATADAATLSNRQDRKVKLCEITCLGEGEPQE